MHTWRKDGQIFHTQDFELFPIGVNGMFYKFSHLVSHDSPFFKNYTSIYFCDIKGSTVQEGLLFFLQVKDEQFIWEMFV